MKKLSAIFLFALLLFSWYGVQPLIHWLEKHADDQMVVLLDKNQYDQSSVIEISVPNMLPYTNESKTFERIDGSVEINGQHYNYVGRKITDDKIIFTCIVNDYRNRLSDSKNKFLRFAYDVANTTSSKKSDQSKSFSFKKAMDDFIDHRLNYAHYPNEIHKVILSTTCGSLTNGFALLLYQPPKSC